MQHVLMHSNKQLPAGDCATKALPNTHKTHTPHTHHTTPHHTHTQLGASTSAATRTCAASNIRLHPFCRASVTLHSKCWVLLQPALVRHAASDHTSCHAPVATHLRCRALLLLLQLQPVLAQHRAEGGVQQLVHYAVNGVADDGYESQAQGHR
mmetsp:Transcript_441/g.1127  ORF Transcript_441/g.1127 Transcript_441/m.1127 type:complete len:153 (+) Transcript_441:192-650(+)|eukprot:1157013-Pelagomonas_calceolata.AAC.3